MALNRRHRVVANTRNAMTRCARGCASLKLVILETQFKTFIIMEKKIETQALINMLDTRITSCLCKMTRTLPEKEYKFTVEGSGCYPCITWEGGHFSFKAFDTMKELKAKLQKQAEIDVNEDTFTLSELVQLLKACDNSEIRSFLVDCLVCRVTK